MAKALLEIKKGMVANVDTTSDGVEIYVLDHDVVREGSIGELKRYLAHADEPVDVDDIVSEDEVMAKLEGLIAEGQAKLEDMTGVWDDAEELDEPEEVDISPYIARR
jgi:hypothetical protein